MNRSQFRWLADLVLKGAPGLSLMCSSRQQAESVVAVWRKAVESGEKFVSFESALHNANLFLTESVIAVFVVNLAEQDEIALEHMKVRQQLQREVEFDNPDNQDD